MEKNKEKTTTKRKGHYPMFDSSKVPDDLCPIATELNCDEDRGLAFGAADCIAVEMCEMRDVLGILPGSMYS